MLFTHFYIINSCDLTVVPMAWCQNPGSSFVSLVSIVNAATVNEYIFVKAETNLSDNYRMSLIRALGNLSTFLSLSSP